MSLDRREERAYVKRTTRRLAVPAVSLGLVISSSAFVSCATSHPVIAREPYQAEKAVIVTADDYGSCLNVNQGIEYAVRHGAITSLSVLGNFTDSLDDLARLSLEYSQIGIGVHLNLTTGKPLLGPDEVPTLVDRDGRFFSVPEFLSRVRRIDPGDLERELTAQVDAVENAGISIDHLSDHNGLLSIYPPFFDILVKLAVRYDVALRSPAVASVKYRRMYPRAGTRKRSTVLAAQAAALNPFGALGLLRYTGPAAFEEKARELDRVGIRHPGVLIDCLYGTPTIENALYILSNLEERTSEIVVHLGSTERSPSCPDGLDTGYFENRERELMLLTSTYLRDYAAGLNVRFIRFSDLVKAAIEP
jgi:predicted glycoside hydrolase/deacetylase ChbG (UPF0249 family)